MRGESHQHQKRLGRSVALKAIFSAFEWLAGKGAFSHRVQWLGDYPLLSTSSPRDAFLVLRFLCSSPQETGDRAPALDPIVYRTLMGDHELIKQLVEREHFTAFIYLDPLCCSQHSAGEALLKQQQAIRELFNERRQSDNLLIVRSDNLHSNGYNSIRESITNLISAEFFMSKGYMVLEDNGSGPDIIAFKTSFLDELRERRFMGRGASISQLATIRALGKVSSSYKEETPEDEIIAVESESVSPRKGMKQLMGGYNSGKFSYMGFFDRRILAAPFFNQGATSFDVLTYDVNGLEYRKCGKDQAASDFWRSKKQAFMNELQSSVKAMLLLNLTYEEIATMVSTRSQTMLQVLQQIPKLQIVSIIDKIENVL